MVLLYFSNNHQYTISIDKSCENFMIFILDSLIFESEIKTNLNEKTYRFFSLAKITIHLIEKIYINFFRKFDFLLHLPQRDLLSKRI